MVLHRTGLSSERLEAEAAALGPWFHNIDLGQGITTAPDHPLGDFPRRMWRRIAPAIASRIHGRTVLDIGCNGGFYAIEMARLGASRVVAIDYDDAYLAQARFAAKTLGLDDKIEFQKLSVYDIAGLGQGFDVVLFMGVFYHLRHPLLALDLISTYAAKDLLVFQSMLRGAEGRMDVARDYAIESRTHFLAQDYPRLHFVEHSYAGDPTNWWIPNRAAVEAMLRSSGFPEIEHIDGEVFLAKKSREPFGEGAVHAAKR